MEVWVARRGGLSLSHRRPVSGLGAWEPGAGVRDLEAGICQAGSPCSTLVSNLSSFNSRAARGTRARWGWRQTVSD